MMHFTNLKKLYTCVNNSLYFDGRNSIPKAECDRADELPDISGRFGEHTGLGNF
jgi:hypothetical protein